MRSVFRNLSAVLIVGAAVSAPTVLGPGAAGQGGFENWDLESGVGQANLVMVARVVRISRVTIVEGAKTDVSLREYRFEPVRVLKCGEQAGQRG